jgi:hypothetical protein
MDALLTLNVFSGSLPLALATVVLCGGLVVWPWLRAGERGR